MNLPNTQNNLPQEKNGSEPENKESLSDVKKKLETGQAIAPDTIKEAQASNLAHTRDLLQNPASGTVINVKQGKGVININTGTVNGTEGKREISSDFYSKQTGFSSSGLPFKGGRL